MLLNGGIFIFFNAICIFNKFNNNNNGLFHPKKNKVAWCHMQKILGLFSFKKRKLKNTPSNNKKYNNPSESKEKIVIKGTVIKNGISNLNELSENRSRPNLVIRSKEDRVIRRADKIPLYNSIITAPSGEIPISEDQRLDYIALSINKDEKEAAVLCSIEGTMELKVDHTFASLRERLRAKGYKKVKSFYTPRQIINLLYEKELTAAMTLEDEVKKNEGLQSDYDDLLWEAMEQGVSDIHIEVRRNTAIVRFRKNGALELVHDWGISYARNMAVVIYQVIAEEKEVSFVEGQQQSAIIDRIIRGQRVRVRLNTLPAYPDGFDMVMRVLRMGARGTKKTLSELGYPKEQINDINISVSKPVGVTIIAGTTGSGKSTSLTTMIGDKINQYTDEFGCRIKVITVEDPPEYEIDNSTQCPVVRSKSGKDGKNPFAEAIKAAMRSDPDVLMVGEVRDEDSAELLVHAVQSGHQAFTTVHAASAIGIVARLRSLGVLNDVLGGADFLAGLIYQTLVPTVCQKCSFTVESIRNIDSEIHTELLGRLMEVANNEEIKKVRFCNKSGCSNCNKGITGRTVVSEIIIPDSVMINYFYEGRDTLALQHFLRNGGKNALYYGLKKMKEGLCDPFDIEHRLGRLNSAFYVSDENKNDMIQNTTLEYEDVRKINNEPVDYNKYDEHLESKLLGNKDAPSINIIDFGGNLSKETNE